MKPFNLKEYLKNPSRKVVTRNGDIVKIHCTDFVDERYPIIARIEDASASISFTKDGKYEYSRDTKYDLFFAPEKHEGWIYIFKHFPNNDYLYNCSRTKSQVFESKESAEKEGKDCLGYITTIKIEWDE